MSVMTRVLRQRFVGHVGIAIVLIGPVAIAAMGLLVIGRLWTEGLGASPLTPLLYSLGMVLGAMAIAIPISLLVGIYLAEYPKDGLLGPALTSALRWLRLLPAPIWGLCGLKICIHTLGLSPAVAVSLALAAMLIPAISLMIRKAFEAIPWDIREGGFVLGASRTALIQSLLLPLAGPRIVEISLLATARALGETAILVMVSKALADGGYIPGLTTAIFGKLVGLKGEAFDSALAPGILWLLVVGLCGAAFAYRHLHQIDWSGGRS